MARTVLVADDSPVIQNKAKGILTGEGFDVVTVSNGVAAIKKLSQLSPLIVLADVSMPGKDGYEVCDFVKRSPDLRHVPVVLVVSDLEGYNQQRAAQVHADAFINKRSTKTPFDPEELISTVAKFVAQSKASARTLPLPVPAAVSDPEEEPASRAMKSRVDLGALSGEMAFTEPASEVTTPAAWPGQSPAAPESAGGTGSPVTVGALGEASESPAPDAQPEPAPAESGPVLIIDERQPVSSGPAAPSPSAGVPEQTMTFRVPAQISGPILKDDVAPKPSSEVPPAAPRDPGASVAATSLESFSLKDAAAGQVRFASSEPQPPWAASKMRPVENTTEPVAPNEEASADDSSHSAQEGVSAVPQPPVDPRLTYRIIQKVVTKTSPAAIPLQAIDEMVNTLFDEIMSELKGEHPKP